VRLRRIGEMPMPIDLMVSTKSNGKVLHYIPLSLMFGEKPPEDNTKRITHEWWAWTHPTYEVELGMPLREITFLEIDPSQRMADIDRYNNMIKVQ
jgi:hypothetical protein